VHPRTRARLDQALGGGGAGALPGVHFVEPLGYLDSLGLLDGARVALTDSGGIQEETTALGIPCLTLRENTERPITIVEGTNTLVGSDADKLRAALGRALAGPARAERRP